jgi:hypothetical protein
MRASIAIAVLVVGACGDQPVGVSNAPRPSIDAAAVTANPHNVLSAIVTARVRDAETIAVHYRLAGTVTHEETPTFEIAGESTRIPVLGLLSDAQYHMKVVASGPGGTTESNEMLMTTGSLPSDLPRYAASGTDPSPGFVTFAAGKYALAIDNSGRVVWYRHFPDGAGLNLMAQPTGRYVLRPPTPAIGDLEPWVEVDVFGEVTRTLGCVGALPNRIHDLLLEPSGSYWVMCDEERTMDLRADGGVANARVTGTVIQHIAVDGTLLFSWSPFDHFQITDLDPAQRTGASVNWTHGNAFDIDPDGNILVSWRSLNEITKIDGRTGMVLWRLGGRRNQFTIIGGDAAPFAGQHSVRSLARGEVLLLDNVGDPRESRAERYLLDDATKVAQLAQAHASVPSVVTEIGGSVQRCQSGRTLVSFGTAGRVEEFDDQGHVVWRVDGHAGYVFRAQRIRSLYEPGVGTRR